MFSVEQALTRITAALSLLPTQSVSLAQACGRVLGEPVVARRTQPPVAVSAMDGYAVRAGDVARTPVTLKRIGEAPAGGAFDGTVTPGTTVRIFTGGPLPEGADAIVIQENVTLDEDGGVVVHEPVPEGKYIRPAGLDFAEGDRLIEPGRVLSPRDIGLAAAMNVPWLAVRRKPRVALLATGDELVRPGEPVGPNQIISSNSLAIAALVEKAGGEAIDLGIARDNEASLRALAAGAQGADMLVTMGGASVGDHDLVQSVLGAQGLDVNFWKVAMRPGKPLIFGSLGGTAMLGLPGNPVSALVCAVIFLVPALRKMLGAAPLAAPPTRARLGRDLAQNDRRQDYLRASLAVADDGEPIATPFDKQDSSVLSGLAGADCLVIRPPFAPAAKKDDQVAILPL